MTALVLSGSGRYADPWHPFARTSAILGRLATEAGFSTRIETDIDRALETLGADVRLLIVNSGDPEGPGPDAAPDDRSEQGLERVREEGDAALVAAIERGIGILVMHAGAASLRAYPSFERALGGRWVRGRSWHPDFSNARALWDRQHPLAVGDEVGFDVEDERYTDLRIDVPIARVAYHDERGRQHPLVWTREFGASRLVYDALGHDERSYESAGHRALLGRALRWLAV